MPSHLRIIALVAFLSAQALPAAPPVTYLDEVGTRFITVETLEGGKFVVSLRTVGGPGAYGHWSGRGEQGPRGIEFSQKVEPDAPPSLVYLASGGQAMLTVKLKPGQAGAQDGGVSGVYRHVSDENLSLLAKKDCYAAEKKLDESMRMASIKAPTEDKPVYAEWKKAWPALRDHLTFLARSRPTVPGQQPVATRPVPGPVGSLPADQQAAYWIQRAETTGAGVNFIGPGVPAGLKSGWEGNYDDGFGGSIEVFVVTNGDGRFTLNAGRGPDGAGGTIEGRIPAKTLKTGKDGIATGEFTDNNKQLKEGELQALLHFRRIGHFLVIESQYAERYSGRGWFDGIYVKRVPPKEEGNP